MKIDFNNAQMSHEFKAEARNKLQPYLSRLGDIKQKGSYDEPESSICLSADHELRKRVKALAEEKGAGVEHLIMVGIGGSNLGAEAVYQALGVRHQEGAVEVLFAETVDSLMLTRVARMFSTIEYPHQVLVVIASKSGRTTETIMNADVIYRMLKERFDESARERVVVISDDGSALSELARKERLSSLSLPQKVGGRYSVLSAVGLFPLAVAGVDIDLFARGANSILEEMFNSEESAAFLSASAQAEGYEKKRRIHDMFVFDPSLETLGKWYRQLLGESIGKTVLGHAGEGSERRIGITPTVSVGSTDLHSVGQLYFGGPKDERFTTFVRRGSSKDFAFSDDGIFQDIVPDLRGESIESVLEALALGVEASYQNNSLPFIDVWFERVNEYELGAFMQWKMVEVMLLAQLLEVNAFDQPAVEDYKENTRRILKDK